MKLTYRGTINGTERFHRGRLKHRIHCHWRSGLQPHVVCVNALVPGVFRTALNQELLDNTPRGKEFLMRTPIKRFGKVEELAGAAIFLASDAAGFITGIALPVDGGFLASGVNQ